MKFEFCGPVHQLKIKRSFNADEARNISRSTSAAICSFDDIMEYRLPKTVMQKLGLSQPFLQATSDDFTFCDKAGEPVISATMYDAAATMYSSNTINILPNATLEMTAPKFEGDSAPQMLMGLMKGDIVVCMVSYEQEMPDRSSTPQFKPNGIFITTPKVYLTTIQLLDKVGYAVDGLEAFAPYVKTLEEYNYATCQAETKPWEIESTVDLG